MRSEFNSYLYKVMRRISFIFPVLVSLVLACGELYDIAKRAEEGDTVEFFAIADRGGYMVLLDANENDVREYQVANTSAVDWGAKPLLQMAEDGSAWITFRDNGTWMWLIYRSDGRNYNYWMKRSKEFPFGCQVSAITAGRGNVYMLVEGAGVDDGFWEFTSSSARHLASFPSGKTLFYSYVDGIMYMTVDGGVSTEIQTYNFATGFHNPAYNSNAAPMFGSFFAAQYDYTFLIGFFNELAIDDNYGLTPPFPFSVPPFDLDYTIEAYVVFSNRIFAAAVNGMLPSADILYFDNNEDPPMTDFQPYHHISDEGGIEIEMERVSGRKIAVGIRFSPQKSGLHIFDHESGEMKQLSGYDVYDVSVRQ